MCSIASPNDLQSYGCTTIVPRSSACHPLSAKSEDFNLGDAVRFWRGQAFIEGEVSDNHRPHVGPWRRHRSILKNMLGVVGGPLREDTLGVKSGPVLSAPAG